MSTLSDGFKVEADGKLSAINLTCDLYLGNLNSGGLLVRK
jgi:hypothetical protein